MENCVLPEDIMLSILTRLHVKSIIRFRSVCKAWRELFSTPWFVKRHEEAMSSSGPQSFFIQCKGLGPNLLVLDSSTGTIKNACLETYSSMEMDFVGCCNGLICLSYPKTSHIILWNPALKLFNVLRLLKHVELSSVSLGLGYDDEGVDFKVVRLVGLKNQGEGKMIVVGAEVYSTNSDSWITVELDFRFSVLWNKVISSALVNGIPYWEANVDSSKALVRFDVKKMLFETVPVLNLNFDCKNYVGWKGSLGAIEHNEQHKSIDVWLFYEGDRTWKKNRAFGTTAIGMDDVLNLQCSNNGATIMVSGTRGFCKLNMLVLVIDSNTGFYRKLCISLPYISDIYSYTESLTYIKRMKHVGSYLPSPF